MVLFQNLIKFS